ncbi:Putative serine/threonine-protein kinase [Glycine soja]|nr:Putative serine/threonine-protein kinase [Glycine soja]
MNLPLLQPLSSFINTLFFFSLFFPTYVSSDSEGYSACEPFSCGQINNISYPFWNSDQQPSYCGHPKFKLDCQQDSVTIGMVSQRFHVIEIDQTSKVLKIARLDLWNDPCTDEYSDVKLDSDFFNYTSNDDEYTLLYDCGRPVLNTSRVNIEGTIPFTCPIGGGFPNAFCLLSKDVGNLKGLGCKNRINVSVLREAMKDALLVQKVLEGGFEVGWSGVDEDRCDGCIKSGGRCGHNESKDAFMCLCLNQQSSDEVCSKSLARSPLAAQTPRPTTAKSLIPPNSPIFPKQSPHAPKEGTGSWRKRKVGGSFVGGVLLYVETMDCKEHIPMLRTVVLTVSWLLLITLLYCEAAYNYSECKEQTYKCGSLINISYPFWGHDQRDSECGGGDLFELKCYDDDTTLLIGSQNYTVKEINIATYTMRLVRTDLARDVCSPQFGDTYLNPTLFSYPPEVHNVTIFYDCTPITNPQFPNSITCGYAVPNIGEGFQYSLIEQCKRRLHVPTDDPEVDYGGGKNSAVEKALDKGFEVKYTVSQDCTTCLGSEGNCSRHDAHFYQNLCHYCPDGSHALHCSKRKINWKVKLIIGVVSGVVGALAVGIIGYLCYRKKKNRYTMSYTQSRSLSSDPSSKDTEKGIQRFTQSFVPGVHLFTYDELEEATNYFDSSKELGEGGFGTVYFGKLRDGRSVAVKRLYENNFKRVAQFMNEIKILANLDHPNLVTLFGCTSRHTRELLLVYEYIPNGTIADHLHGQRSKPGKLPWHIRMNIAVETASALKFLHQKDIIHRDVKTNNILLDNNFCVKVADFGLSRLFPDHVTHVSTAPQGTPGYVDPEYHQCYQLTKQSDVYSFGVVLVELISSLPAVDITRHRQEIKLSDMAINKIHSEALHELVDPSLGFESNFKVRKMINAVAELAFQCLQSSKEMRPSMEEVADTLKDIQSDGKHKSQPEVMDITSTADDVVLLKDDPPPPSPDSNAVSKLTTPNASG